MNLHSDSPEKPSQRALFVATSVPENEQRSASGFHRRQRLLIDAIKSVCTDIEVLLYVLPGPEATSETTRQSIQERLCRLWEGRFTVTLCERERYSEGSTYWRQFFEPALSFFKQPDYATQAGERQVAALNACLERKPDFIFVHRLLSVPPVLLTREDLPPVFMDMDDVEHVAFIRSVAQPPMWPSKRLEYLRVPALMYGERQAIRRCAATFVCSETDRLKLQQLYSTRRVVAIPNAIAAKQQSDTLTDARTLLLLGDYSYAPNHAGAEFFIDKVWPRVIAAVPDARITIAGLRSELLRHASAPPPGINFPGFVTDLDAAYAAARIVVCPILSGGGTRVKIMEAAAYGKPIVSTTIGAEGIQLENEHEILLRDSPERFAEGCIQLLRDHAAAAAMGKRAAQAIQARYERSHVVAKLADMLQNPSRASRSGKRP